MISVNVRVNAMDLMSVAKIEIAALGVYLVLNQRVEDVN